MNYSFDYLKKEDYYNGFLDLLGQLTVVNQENITFEDFAQQLENTNNKILVIKFDGQIVGTGSILIEYKFVRGLRQVGHIEDVVIDWNHRKAGLGKLLINKLVEIGKENKCYKIILSCSAENKSFYEKCGFINKNLEMSLYF